MTFPSTPIPQRDLMVLLLVSPRVPREPAIKRPPPAANVIGRPDESSRYRNRGDQPGDDIYGREGRAIFRSLFVFWLVIVMPALLTLLYLIANPGTLMFEIQHSVDPLKWPAWAAGMSAP